LATPNQSAPSNARRGLTCHSEKLAGLRLFALGSPCNSTPIIRQLRRTLRAHRLRTQGLCSTVARRGLYLDPEDIEAKTRRLIMGPGTGGARTNAGLSLDAGVLGWGGGAYAARGYWGPNGRLLRRKNYGFDAESGLLAADGVGECSTTTPLCTM